MSWPGDCNRSPGLGGSGRPHQRTNPKHSLSVTRLPLTSLSPQGRAGQGRAGEGMRGEAKEKHLTPCFAWRMVLTVRGDISPGVAGAICLPRNINLS